MTAVAHIAFDTLKFVETLTVAGMPVSQAKALSEAQKVVFEEALDGTLATKADIQELKTDIQELRAETKAAIQELRTETKAAIQELRAETKADITGVNGKIAEVEAGLKLEIPDVKADVRVLKWMMGFMLAGIGALILKAFF